MMRPLPNDFGNALLKVLAFLQPDRFASTSLAKGLHCNPCRGQAMALELTGVEVKGFLKVAIRLGVPSYHDRNEN